MIYVLQKLIGDTVNVSEHIFVLFKKVLLIEKFRLNLVAISHDAFRKINLKTAPEDATGLVRQLIIDSLEYDFLNVKHQRASAPPRNRTHDLM